MRTGGTVPCRAGRTVGEEGAHRRLKGTGFRRGVNRETQCPLQIAVRRGRELQSTVPVIEHMKAERSSPWPSCCLPPDYAWITSGVPTVAKLQNQAASAGEHPDAAVAARHPEGRRPPPVVLVDGGAVVREVLDVADVLDLVVRRRRRPGPVRPGSMPSIVSFSSRRRTGKTPAGVSQPGWPGRDQHRADRRGAVVGGGDLLGQVRRRSSGPWSARRPGAAQARASPVRLSDVEKT